MAEEMVDRLAQLEEAVRRAADALGRLREDNERLRREVARLTGERKQVLTQIDAILGDINKLDLG
jgi:hypothetical protein